MNVKDHQECRVVFLVNSQKIIRTRIECLILSNSITETCKDVNIVINRYKIGCEQLTYIFKCKLLDETVIILDKRKIVRDKEISTRGVIKISRIV